MGAIVEDRDLGYKQIVKEVKKLGRSSTNVGLFGSGGSASVNLAERAAVHEYGTRNGNIPSRPFMRSAFDKNRKSLIKKINSLYGKVIKKECSAKKLLKITGEWFTGKVKQEITIGNFKRLKSQTIKRKKSSKPLIDTGNLRSSVTHKEEMK